MAALLAVTATLVLVAPAETARADATPARVHVHGGSRIDAHAGRFSGKLVLSGVLDDDGARPLAGEKVSVSVASQDDPSHALALSATDGVAACDGASGAGAQPTLARRDVVVATTDDGGRFCVQIGIPVGRFVARFSFDGGARVDGSRAELGGDLSRRPVTLRFDPEPRSLDLGEAASTIDVIATAEDDGGSAPAPSLALTLTNELGAVLATATTGSAGRARFVVASARLGAPGRGEVRVAFAGTDESAATTAVVPVERRVHVDLSVPEAADGRIGPASPDDGVAIDVAATERGLAEARGAPSGMVVARIGDSVVGAAPLVAGRARVIVTFAASAAGDAAIVLAYAPDAPWFVAGTQANVLLSIRGASPWRNIAILLAGACVVVWLILGRARASDGPKSERKPSGARAVAAGGARIDVVRAEPGASGWRGVVLDAHDSTPIAGARVAIERASFERVETLATAATGERGEFSLAPIQSFDGDRLAAEGPWHARVEQRLPPSGELAIALVLRKRAVLDRLVAWARRRGKPFDAPPEPTPGHVRRAAGGSFAVARWADAVERAAFGEAAIDAHAEGEIERLVPDPADAPRGDGGGQGHENDTRKDPPPFDDPAKADGPDDRGDRD